jgi:hypothetical protein
MSQSSAAVHLQTSQPLLCKFLKNRPDIETSALTNENTDRFIQSWSPFEIILQTSARVQGLQGRNCYIRQPTRQIFSATTYKLKEIEGNNITPMPGLLTKK